MRVAIVAPSPIPFGPGGAEALWAGLYSELLEHSPHEVELVKVPIRETTLPEVMAAYETFSTLDLSHFDVVISGKYPAWMVRHPRHVVYLLHPLRGLYDSYGTFGRPREVERGEPLIDHLVATARGLRREFVPDLFERWHLALDRLGAEHPMFTFPGPLARTLVHGLDGAALDPAEVVRHAAISWTVAARADYFPPGRIVHVIHPPSSLPGLHRGTGPGEFFFTASRHDAPKRLDLLIAGMRHYAGERRLLIAGVGPETERLRELAADPRVVLVGRLSPNELADHYARSVAVPFIPVDEDLGLITHEALSSGRPVLTTTDAGGPTELVRDGINGVVVDPTPAAIGAGLARVERLAAEPGTERAALASVRGQTWSRVAHALLDGLDERPANDRPAVRDARPRWVVTSTFPVWPPRGGGQLRAFHLYGALTDEVDVDLVCLAPPTAVEGSRVVRPGVVQHVVPRTAEHEEAEAAVAAEAGIPVTDIVASRFADLTPRYAQTLGRLCQGAAGVILADPFLAPVAHAVAPGLPTVYDAYNCEYVLKSQMLPDSPVSAGLLEDVRAIEAEASDRAARVLTVSTEDRDSIAELYGVPASRFVLAPNGTDLGTVRYVPAGVRRSEREAWLADLHGLGEGAGLERLAVFIGSWHEPNIEAAHGILRFAPELPEVAFLLVGRHADAVRHHATPRNVFLLGEVPDLVKTRLLGCADVALAPLLSGSGTNLKVAEYLAAGIPVVTTPVGARGIDADRAPMSVVELEHFPDAIREVLRSPDAERTVAAAAYVRRAYDWGSIGRRVIPVLADVARESAAIGGPHARPTR